MTSVDRPAAPDPEPPYGLSGNVHVERVDDSAQTGRPEKLELTLKASGPRRSEGEPPLR